ncbi:MAG: GNAT family protein, partial [Candidatus Peregrinibacteria bacterium]
WYQKMTQSPHDEIWCIHLKENGPSDPARADKLIGNCGYHGHSRHPGLEGQAFAGIIIGEKDEWGKGYGTDAFRTLMRYIKEKKGRKEVYLNVDTLHHTARWAYEKVGFRVIGTERNFSRTNSNQEQYLMKIEL